MVSENSEQGADQDAAALALEVKALRALIEDLQAGLGPGVQSSLRERSSELQRLGGELDERRVEAERLRAALDAAEAEAGRWRDAARRGLDEIAERARAAAARFEAQTAELNHALTAIRAELAASQAETAAATQARDAEATLGRRRQKRVRALEAEVLEHERQRLEMTGSWSWKLTAPLRWLSAAVQRLLKRGARLRRQMAGR